MLSVNINIDPKSEEDLNNTLEFIHCLLCMLKDFERGGLSNSSSYSYQKGFDASKGDSNKVAEPEEAIKMDIKENSKNQEAISEEDKLILDLENDKKDAEKKYKELEDQLREELNKSKKKDEEFSSKIKQCEDIYNKELRQKDEEILRLNKSLESYSVSFGSDDPNDKHFFEVTKNKTLEESMISSDSLYCASKTGDIYKFSINDDGPVKAAFTNIEHFFEPFCQIQDNIEGANWLNTKTVGKAKLIGSQLQIIEKVVITLIKQ